MKGLTTPLMIADCLIGKPMMTTQEITNLLCEKYHSIERSSVAVALKAMMEHPDCDISRYGDRKSYCWRIHGLGKNYLFAAIRACPIEYRLPWMQQLLNERSRVTRPMQVMIDEFDQRLAVVRQQVTVVDE